jgi:hypothetical protein
MAWEKSRTLLRILPTSVYLSHFSVIIQLGRTGVQHRGVSTRKRDSAGDFVNAMPLAGLDLIWRRESGARVACLMWRLCIEAGVLALDYAVD